MPNVAITRQAVSLLSVVTRTWNGFKDNAGNEVKPGSAHSAWFFVDFESAPIEAKIADANLAAALRALGPDAEVVVDLECRAVQSSLVYRLLSFDRPKVAANGKAG